VAAIQSGASGGASGKLIIGYNNSDVDIVSGASITEVPDLKLSGISGDKTIHGIYVLGDNAYLSTGLGIVVVSTTQYNVQGTYIIGADGVQTPVYAVTSDSLYLYGDCRRIEESQYLRFQPGGF